MHPNTSSRLPWLAGVASTMVLISLSGFAFAGRSDDDKNKVKNMPRQPALTRPEPRRVEAPRPAPAPVRPEPRRMEAPKLAPPPVRSEPRREVRQEPRRIEAPVARPEPRVSRPPTPVVAKPQPVVGKSFALAAPPKDEGKRDRDKPGRDRPQGDVPRREIPKVDAPKFNPPKADAPRREAPKFDAPRFNPPKADLPRREIPKVDTPRFNPPKADAPVRDIPKVDAPKLSPPKVDPPRREIPKADPPKFEPPKTDAPVRRDPPKVDRPKTDAPKVLPPDIMPHKIDPSLVKPPRTDRQPGSKETDDERLRRRGFERRPAPEITKPKPPEAGKPIDRKEDKFHAVDPKHDRRGPGIVDPGRGVNGKHPDLVIPGRREPGGPKFDHRPIDPAEAAKHNFAERVKSGQIDHLAKGKIAEQVNLKSQYKMFNQGDVARRMNVEQNIREMHARHAVNVLHADKHLSQIYHADRPYYHGVVAPHYTRDCFRYNYWGPRFSAGVCWYPTWLGWVDWSWHHHVHPIYDPRPIWCRPVIYAPAPVWVYYEAPVWRPLPTVACGTWVDVPPAVVKDAFDLQLLAVRFVDPGHPEEKLGPRYRVWFRNNSDKPITTPFNVTAFAANDDRLVEGVPQAGLRVTSLDAGDTQSVDIRLPLEAMSLGRDPEGKPAPFAMLHVIADANREIEDTQRENNGVRLKTEEVLPVDPVLFMAKSTSVATGDEVVLAGEGLGPLPGQIIVRLGDLELDAEIIGWYDLGVRFTIPKVPLSKAAEAEVIAVRGDSAAANAVKITVLPPDAAEAKAQISEGPQLH